ncbi:saccharopine dehydrogenase family protein [Candidatus Sororendozoicomonas aggregata]|uniref:saccharopine dehydrogenase family protein n=1 Tax=Candidatus Sororendozoicomonas aggregata TaxID=3073239 RepID=UPI002ED44072
MSNHQYTMIIFGATSFVGKILTRYLLETLGTESDTPWAIAGRNQKKLDTLKEQLGPPAKNLVTFTADAHNEASLTELCNNTRVIISTVGPYALYGEPLVKACAQSGTDYCDLAGEVPWIHAMIDKYEPIAQQSGARIVNACGFDSIPSDMGVYHLQQAAQQAFGKPCTTVKMRVKTLKGGFSGGTVASIINSVKAATNSASLRQLLKDPFSLCPKGHSFSAVQFNVQSPRYDTDFSTWTAPFIMAGINTRIVHRTNALLNKQYGEAFKYDEAIITGDGSKGKKRALFLTLGLKSLLVGAVLKPTRWAMTSWLLPKPGEGPSQREQDNGRYELLFHGTTDNGHFLKTRVTGDKDPGYGSTAKMLGQAALAITTSKKRGGFWTPSTAFDLAFIDQLTNSAGLTFEVET